MDADEHGRRRLLIAAASLVGVTLAGCLDTSTGDGAGDQDDDQEPPDDDDGSTDGETTSTADRTEAEPRELATDPDDDDFDDKTGQDVVEIITREGGDGEQSFTFDPPFVRVDAGSTIRWENTDGVFHTVTSTESLDNRSGGGDRFDAQISSEGDTFEWTAEEPGRQSFYCSPHAGFMYGSIEIE